MHQLKIVAKFLILIAIFLTSESGLAANSEVRMVFSESMQREIPVSIILPDAYADSTTSWPVLYLLHGYTGNHSNWPELTDIPNLANRHQMIVVCPDGATDSWYLDRPAYRGYNYKTHVAREVVAFVDRTYRTVESRQGRAISGLSMGGHGALYLAIQFPDVFGAAGSMSGGLDLRPFPGQWNLDELLGDQKTAAQRWEEVSVNALLPQLAQHKPALIIDCGVDDFFLDVNRQAHQILLENKIDHDYIERDGGHTPAYWANAVAYQMLFFEKFFRRPAGNDEQQ